MGDFSARFADKFTSGEVIKTETSYQSANVNITISTHRDDENDQTYYIEDIYIRSIECLRTLFADDAFGKAISEDVLSMANRANAVAAINSDYYGYGNGGIVIRNGELYRDKWEDGEEVLVIFRDGTMRVYRDQSELDINQAMADGAWQSFSFGPAFLDGDGQLREQRRGNSYEGILMDPPSYGRGPGGEVWKLENELYGLVSECARLLSDRPLFMLINSYTTGLQPAVLNNMLTMTAARGRGGLVTADEIVLPVTEGGVLPCGASGRWQAE